MSNSPPRPTGPRSTSTKTSASLPSATMCNPACIFAPTGPHSCIGERQLALTAAQTGQASISPRLAIASEPTLGTPPQKKTSLSLRGEGRGSPENLSSSIPLGVLFAGRLGLSLPQFIGGPACHLPSRSLSLFSRGVVLTCGHLLADGTQSFGRARRTVKLTLVNVLTGVVMRELSLSLVVGPYDVSFIRSV
jgi:hypothetical protein